MAFQPAVTNFKATILGFDGFTVVNSVGFVTLGPEQLFA
jgi:hypothetical protein